MDFKDRMIEAYERGECGYYEAYDYVRESMADAADRQRKAEKENPPEAKEEQHSGFSVLRSETSEDHGPDPVRVMQGPHPGGLFCLFPAHDDLLLRRHDSLREAGETEEEMTAQEIAEPNTILRCEVGSGVHGLAIEGTDDRDEMGVCLEGPEYVIGLKMFEQWVHRTQPQGQRSGPGDLDVTIYSARKYCSLALKGNPSVLIPLFVPEARCSVLSAEGRSLRSYAWAFASKRAGAAFLGYMQQQRQRLLGERGQMNVKRPELIEAYGYDTKYAAHMLRLGFQGVEYLTSGKLSLPMPEEPRALIRSVRTGELYFNTMLTMAGELEADLKVAIDSSPLPEQPDYATVNWWLANTYEGWWHK